MMPDSPDLHSHTDRHRVRCSSSPSHHFYTAQHRQLPRQPGVVQSYAYGEEPEEPYKRPSSYNATAMNAPPHGALHHQGSYGPGSGYHQRWSHAQSDLAVPYRTPWEYSHPAQQQQQQPQNLYPQSGAFYPQSLQQHWSIEGLIPSVPAAGDGDLTGLYVQHNTGHLENYHPVQLTHGLLHVGEATGDDQNNSISTAGGSDVQPHRKRRRQAKPRPGKRFVWSDDMHGKFVTAIFETGLKCAFAEQITLLLQSSSEHESVSLDAIAQLLEQYRAKQHSVRDAFLAAYLAHKAKQASAAAVTRPESQASLGGSSGAAAEDRARTGDDDDGSRPVNVCWLTLPLLTAEELASPLGTTLNGLTDTLRTLERRLLEERAAARTATLAGSPTDGGGGGAPTVPPTTTDARSSFGSAESLRAVPGRRPPSREQSSLSLADLEGLGSFDPDSEVDEHLMRFLRGL